LKDLKKFRYPSFLKNTMQNYDYTHNLKFWTSDLCAQEAHLFDFAITVSGSWGGHVMTLLFACIMGKLTGNHFYFSYGHSLAGMEPYFLPAGSSNESSHLFCPFLLDHWDFSHLFQQQTIRVYSALVWIMVYASISECASAVQSTVASNRGLLTPSEKVVVVKIRPDLLVRVSPWTRATTMTVIPGKAHRCPLYLRHRRRRSKS
jgi:hypothetical protein